MVPNMHLTKYDDDPFDDPERYKRLVGKLNSHCNCLDIAFAVSVVSQFMTTPTIKHWAALEQILCYLKGALGLRIVYTNNRHTRIEVLHTSIGLHPRLIEGLLLLLCLHGWKLGVMEK
uniref:Reverse transcriptase Ty1/copia-type domain-containing protein n=1 Tax=Solanum lycopersicum TaxID=4081 RepID=A0A3Q7G1L4_SOLLC